MEKFYLSKVGKLIVFLLFLLSITADINATTFYNQSGGNCNVAGNWNTNSTGSGGTAAVAADFTTSGNVFIVQNGTMTQSANWTLGAGVNLTITTTLTNSSTYTITIPGTVTLSGTFNNNSSGTVNFGTLTMTGTANLNKGGTGTLTLGAGSTFASGTTVTFTNGADKFDPQFNYGNLVFSDPTNSPSNPSSPLRVQGNLTVNKGNFYCYTGANNTATGSIGGNLTINFDNGAVNFYVCNGTGSPTLTVTGTITLTSSTNSNLCNFYVGSSSGSPTLNAGTININPASGYTGANLNFYVNSGTGSAVLNAANINFTGGTTWTSSNFYVNSGTAGTPVLNVSGTVNMTIPSPGGPQNFYCTSGAGGATVTIPTLTFSSNYSTSYPGNFYVVGPGASGSPTVTLGRLTSNNTSSGTTTFYVNAGSGNPTLTISGTTSLTSAWTTGANFIVCNSTGSATVNMLDLSLNGTSTDYSNFVVKTTAAAAGTSPSVTITGNVTMNGGTFDGNKSTGGTPIIHITGNVTFTNSGASMFRGASNSGASTITIDGNIDMTAQTDNANVVHVSSDADGSPVGNVTMNIMGSILLGAYGHMDLCYSNSGGNNTINVYGDAYGTANTILFGGPHCGNRSNALTKLIFKSPATGTATGRLSMRTGNVGSSPLGECGTSVVDSRTAAGQFNVQIEANRIVTLYSDIELGTNRTFTVDAGGTLITGPSSAQIYHVTTKIGCNIVAGICSSTGPSTGTVFTLSGTSGGLYATLDANATPALMLTASTGNITTNTRTYSSTANYKFSSASAQTTGDFITGTTPTASTVNKIIVNNTAAIPNGVTLDYPVLISSDLNFLNGRLITTTTNLPTVDYAGTVTGYTLAATNTKYVDGPLAKKLNSTAEFTFPTGKSSSGGIFRPFAITPATTTAVTYRSELMYASPTSGGFNVANVLSPVQWVCPSFYWHTIRTSGTNVDASVRLYYANGDTSSTYAYTGAGQWLSGNWNNVLRNLGPASPFRNVISMSPVTNIPTGITNPFTLVASNQPLPLHLISFTGKKYNGYNQISWKAFGDEKIKNYVLEKSTNGNDFQVAHITNSALKRGVSNDFEYKDSQPSKVSYYRLKEVDVSDKAEYSDVITLVSGLTGTMSFQILPFQESKALVIHAEASGFVPMKIYDMTGRMITDLSRQIEKGETTILFNKADYSSGMYILTSDGETPFSQRFSF